jgi:hypothetical protein
MEITKENAYAVAKELEHQSKNSDSLSEEIATAIQVVEHESILPRKDEDILRFFADKKLTHTWVTNIDGKVDFCQIDKEGFFLPIAEVPCDGISYESLKQAIEYVMDLEEL